MAEQAPADLTSCDREPIQIPGAIQPHGVLLGLREPALEVSQVSENVAASSASRSSRCWERRSRR